MPSPIEAGDLVEVRDERWRLSHRMVADSGVILTLNGVDTANHQSVLSVIDGVDTPTRVSSPRLRRRSRRVVARCALHALATAQPRGHLWTAAAADMELWPYQLQPALAAVRGASRLLLADAVGLGKTIQAGLILSELRARGWVQHALVVCPAGLRQVWAQELQHRFGMHVWLADPLALAERIAELPPGSNPWSGHAVVVASIDLIKRSEVMRALSSVPIDVIVADEAHHLTPGSDRAVAALAARTPWCVLVTATPHSGDRDAFAALTAIGGTDDPLVVFRRTRSSAGVSIARHTRTLPVSPSGDERQLLDGIETYARELWHASEEPHTRLLATTLARRAASSPAAILRTLGRRAQLLAAREPIGPDAEQPALPWDEADASDLLDDDDVLGAGGLHDALREQHWIGQLSALGTAVGQGSKMRVLARILRRLGEPAVVFTEYRDTLEAAAVACAHAGTVVRLHGGLSIGERLAAIDAFNSGAATVLLATDAGGEGLNLHHRCRFVINLELPWNPLRLEQRAGRVDRIGQRRVVHDVRLYFPHTIEHRVLERLRERQQRAASEMTMALHESEMAKSIFTATTPLRLPLPASTTPTDEAEAEAVRIVEQRRLLRLAPMAGPGAWCGRVRPGSLLVLARVRGEGTGSPSPTDIRAYRVRIHQAPHSNAEHRRLLAQVADRIRGMHVPGKPLDMPIVTRLARLRRQLCAEVASPYQDSLFDDRAAIDAAHRAAAIDALDRPLRRLETSLRDHQAQQAVGVDILAAWPEDRA